MSTDSAPAPARWVADAWPSIQAAVTKGLSRGSAATQLKAFTETGDGADARRAIRLVTDKPGPGSIAAAVDAHLDDTYDLSPEPLTLLATRNGVIDSSGDDPSAAITSWATGARDAELVWLCTWIAAQPTGESEYVLDANDLDHNAAAGARLLLPPAASSAAESRDIVHLIRRDKGASAVRLPPAFRYLRHADFDLTWRAGQGDEIELELVARVRLTGWDEKLARRYRKVSRCLT